MADPSSDPHESTIELGVRSLALITRNRTSADPVSYELWYEHVSGRHRELSAEIAERSQAGPLSDIVVRDLHARHLTTRKESDQLAEIGVGAQAEIQVLLDVVRAALGDLAEIDDDLRGTAEKLSDPELGQEDARGLLELAVGATRKICSTNHALQTRMRESQASIKALQSELEASRSEALTDGLTGLLNRRAFDDQLRLRLERAREKGAPLSLMMIDIDHFKRFNDTHGHPVGDQVLRLVGSCLKQAVGPGDVPARYGGEEFAVISLGQSLPDAMRTAEAIRARIGGYEIVQQGTKRSLGRVTISIGVAALQPGEAPEILLRRADERLYAAKRGGRNRVEADAALTA